MNRRLLAVLPLLAFMTSGCAALVADSETPIAMRSDPEGAEVWVDGNKMGVTPDTLELANKSRHVVTFKKDGREATAVIQRRVGEGWVVLDILVGLIPATLDAITGSRYVVPDIVAAILPVSVDAVTSSWHVLHPHVVSLTLAPARSN